MEGGREVRVVDSFCSRKRALGNMLYVPYTFAHEDDEPKEIYLGSPSYWWQKQDLLTLCSGSPFVAQ